MVVARAPRRARRRHAERPERRRPRLDGGAGHSFLVADGNAATAAGARRPLEVQPLSIAPGAGPAQRGPGLLAAAARRLPRPRQVRDAAVRGLMRGSAAAE